MKVRFSISLARGSERQRVIRDELDYERFLQLLTESLTHYAVRWSGLVLVANHAA